MTDMISENAQDLLGCDVHPQASREVPMRTSALKSPRTVSVLGAGLSLGQPLGGVEGAPDALRQAGLVQAILEQGWGVKDLGDVRGGTPEQPTLDRPLVEGAPVKNARALGQACQRIARLAEDAARTGSLCLTLGGDHSVAKGSIAGLLNVWQDLSVIWVDAHGDFNTPLTSPSGNLHGMPLAALTGAFDLSVYPGFEWFKGRLDPQRVALVGVRSLDLGEKALLRSAGIRVFTMTEVDRFGIGRVMDMALEHVSRKGRGPIHLSYDIDALDPSIAPSTGTRVRGGLNYREAHYIAEAVAETGRLVSMDLVEVNPGLASEQNALAPGEADPTIELGVELVSSALGKRIYSDAFLVDCAKLTG